ncbi:sensor histidine kinase [Oligoflexus tunisiensis]|uniref:sensor histidine kinase n=1 Tax=Oligoflexus tunisiensis TaxID=708132 RepID=UPI00114CDE84|nr:HAMP domain-containing sensor histidine kinase [Oligoflexus tunisiensis]
MSRRSIRLKNVILSGSFLLALFGIMASVGLMLMTSYLGAAAKGIKIAVDSIVASEELHVNLLHHYRNQLLFNLTGATSHALQRDEAEAQLRSGIQSIDLYINTDAERVLARDIQDRIQTYLSRAGRGAITDYGAADAEVDDIARRIRKLIQLNQEQALSAGERVARQDRMADILGISIIALLLITLLALGFGTHFIIYKPLVSLREIVKLYGQGQFRARAEPNGPQELQEMAAVFNEMAHNLENSHKNQQRFLSAVAHDLRNPLSAIKMAMHLIADSDKRNKIPDLAEIVKRQSDHLDRMVSDLLDRTRVEAGELKLQCEDHDLRVSVNQAVRLYQTTSTIHNITMRLPEVPIVAHCDPTRIGQVLNNLLSNAIKYSPEGGAIEVDLACQDGSALISVTDQGLGISPDECAQIFEPFRRSPSTRENIPGVGLGLSVSRRIVEAHGGNIEVRSQKGAGSTFIIRLPLLEKQ